MPRFTFAYNPSDVFNTSIKDSRLMFSERLNVSSLKQVLFTSPSRVENVDCTLRFWEMKLKTLKSGSKGRPTVSDHSKLDYAGEQYYKVKHAEEYVLKLAGTLDSLSTVEPEQSKKRLKKQRTSSASSSAGASSSSFTTNNRCSWLSGYKHSFVYFFEHDFISKTKASHEMIRRQRFRCIKKRASSVAVVDLHVTR